MSLEVIYWTDFGGDGRSSREGRYERVCKVVMERVGRSCLARWKQLLQHQAETTMAKRVG